MSGERDDVPHVEQGDLHADDGDENEGVASLFASGWFRVLLVSTVLAAGVMVALPYVLDRFEPTRPSAEAPPVQPRSKFLRGSASSAPARTAEQRTVERASASAVTPKPTAPTPKTIAMAGVPARSEPRAAASETGPRPAHTEAVATQSGAREPDRSAAATERGAAVARTSRPPGPSVTHWVQIGLFKDVYNAERLARDVRSQGFSVRIASVTRSPGDATAGGIYHVVRAGAFPDEAGAAKARDDLKTRGYSGFLINESIRFEGR